MKSFCSFRVVIPIVAVCLLFGCEKRPQDVLSDKEMADLLADIHLSESYIADNGNAYLTDSSRKALRQAILRDHGVTEAQLDSTLAWYGRNMDKYSKLYDRVVKILEKRSNIEPAEAEGSSLAGNFLFPRMVQISPLGLSTYSFDFPAEELAKGAILELKARISPVLSRGNMAVYLAVDYNDNTTDYTYSSSATPHSGKLSLSLQTDSALEVKRVYGFMRSAEERRNILWLDSISISATALNPVSYATERSRSRNYNPIPQKVKYSTVSPDSASLPAAPTVVSDDPNKLRLTGKPEDRLTR